MTMQNNTLLYLSAVFVLFAQSSMAAEPLPASLMTPAVPAVALPDVNRTIQVKPEQPAMPVTSAPISPKPAQAVPLPLKPAHKPEKISADVVDKTEEGAVSLPVPLRGEELNLRSVQKAFDTAAPTATIKSYEYDPTRRYDLRLRVYTGTLIKLPEDEEIKAMALGDVVNFAVTPFTKDNPNLAYVQVINAAGVDTTLTLVGKSKRIYNFYLRGDGVNSSRVPTQMIEINAPAAVQLKSFQFEEEGKGAASDVQEREPYAAKAAQKQSDYLRSIPTASAINTQYKIYGDKSAAGVAPYAVYDDGHFTYLDYRDMHGELPALFRVNDGIDSRNNTDKKDGFLIAQGVSQEGWTLKHGDKIICIRPTVNIRDYWQKAATSPVKASTTIQKSQVEEMPAAPKESASWWTVEYSYPSEKK